MLANDTGWETAVRALTGGKEEELRRQLSIDKDLVMGRSPDGFAAPLLHYIAANGVADEWQRTPPNAPLICQILLDAGADPNACGASYGGGPNATVLCLLVTSWHPFAAGVQAELVEVLVRGGAHVDGNLADGAPLAAALLFGYTGAAEALVLAGARTDSLFFHAGLGDLAGVRAAIRGPGVLAPDAIGPYQPQIEKPWPPTPGDAIQEAFHLAVTHGRKEVAEFLLAEGASVNGTTLGHHCELPLVQALFVHELGLARWLLDRGAEPDRVDGKRGQSARQHVAARGPVEASAWFPGDGA